MLDDALWRETSVLIDEACGIAGSHLVIVGGHSHDDAEWLFDKAYWRGELREEQARDYVETTFPATNAFRACSACPTDAWCTSLTCLPNRN